MAAGWFKAMRVASKRRATVLHGHWVIPGGLIAARAAGGRPLVVSLHGSDVFVAERHAIARRLAGSVFRRAGWITACSDDLADRAARLGADPARMEVVPYGVDVARFAPNPEARRAVRTALGLGDAPMVFTAGRLVRKKGFEYLIDAAAQMSRAWPDLRVFIAGDGDLGSRLERRAAASIPGRVRLLGNRSQDEVARLAAAADVVVVPSVRDSAGNVDGLPNFALEALATGTPVVATDVGGLPQAVEDGVNGRLVRSGDAAALAAAIADVLGSADGGRALGRAARSRVQRDFGWDRVAERFVEAYARAAIARRA
jgi:glycosyltransferase involved in cell wall biosynthesis